MKPQVTFLIVLFLFFGCEEAQKNGNDVYFDSSESSKVLATIDTTACGEDAFIYPPICSPQGMSSIPDTILSKMSTCGLVKTCFSFPGFGFYTAFNNEQEVFESFLDTYDVYRELKKRDDFAEKMISNFAKIQVTDSTNTLKFEYINLLFSGDDFLSALNNLEIKQLIVIAFDKVKAQNQHSEVFGVPYSTCYVLSRLMIIQKYEPFTKAIENNNDKWGGPLFQNITLSMKEILQFAKNYFNSLN